MSRPHGVAVVVTFVAAFFMLVPVAAGCADSPPGGGGGLCGTGTAGTLTLWGPLVGGHELSTFTALLGVVAALVMGGIVYVIARRRARRR